MGSFAVEAGAAEIDLRFIGIDEARKS